MLRCAAVNTSLLKDPFGHHVWATLRLIDACLVLTPEQLQASVSGTYGVIIETMRHIVGADASYLFVLSAGQVPMIDEAALDLAQLRTVMEANGEAWSSLLAENLDPDRVVTRHRDDGSQSQAPMSIRLGQALHHGSDHRSQICTALTALGIEPPAIDVWDFADHGGRLVVVPPAS
jgi:uncharacterized damage-inducible protein DinB